MQALRHPDWYLVAEQRFRRRAGVRAVPQRFRGADCLVLADELTGQSLRLTDRAAALWAALDGRTSAHDIWRRLGGQPRQAPSQAEMVDWLMQLVSAGLVLSDHELNPDHLTDRATQRRNRQDEARAASPLSIKLPLMDPGALIDRTYPVVRPLFSRAGALAFAALMIVALVLAVQDAPALAASIDGAVLSQSGLLLLVLSYPVMKALHELAHGWAVRHFGRAVREAGVMLLVFFPVPYVDASAANAFPDPRHRMWVGAAGIVAELAIAALAFLIWRVTEAGELRAVLFSFMLMGTVSTLAFNGNPLLKFDAYFVLCDALEIPNLATQAGGLLQDGFLSRVLGLRPEHRVPSDEARILRVYGWLSLAYRLVLTGVVVAVVSQLFFVLGLLLAAWSVFAAVLLPLWRLARRGARMARAQNRVRRSLWRLALPLAVLAGLGFGLPLPFSVVGEGRVIPTQAAELRLGSAGRLVAVTAVDGATVARGQALLLLENAEQAARLRALDQALADVAARLALGATDAATRQALRREEALIRATRAEVAALDAATLLAAPLAGRLAWAGGRPPAPGRHLAKGDLAGHIIAPDALEVVLAFPAAFSGRIAPGAAVVLRGPDGRDRHGATITRLRVLDAGGVVPEALRADRGGPVPLRPEAPDRALVAALVGFVVPQDDLTALVGMRVAARIDLPPAPVFDQLAFHLRALFLRVTRL